MNDLAIAGIGLHPFGRHDGKSEADMAVFAIREALADAGLGWNDIQYACGASKDGRFADSLVSRLGLRSIPFTNVSGGCATGGSALINACMSIQSGLADIALVVGYDKHLRGMFGLNAQEWNVDNWYGEIGFLTTVQFFAMKTQRYMHDYGISNDSLVKVAMKAYHNGSLNPKAWRRSEMDYETIANSRVINLPFRQYMVCSPSEGAAAIVICKGDVARRLTRKPVYIKGYALRTRQFGSLEVFSPSKPLENAPSPTTIAAKAACDMAGIGPDEIQIAQVQDSEPGNEIMHMAETGLCSNGEQERLIQDGSTGIDGFLPINTDGGLMANGEPIGASALRQVYETCLQLRGDATGHQVANSPKNGLCQVYGAPGVSSVVILQR